MQNQIKKCYVCRKNNRYRDLMCRKCLIERLKEYLSQLEEDERNNVEYEYNVPYTEITSAPNDFDEFLKEKYNKKLYDKIKTKIIKNYNT